MSQERLPAAQQAVLDKICSDYLLCASGVYRALWDCPKAYRRRWAAQTAISARTELVKPLIDRGLVEIAHDSYDPGDNGIVRVRPTKAGFRVQHGNKTRSETW